MRYFILAVFLLFFTVFCAYATKIGFVDTRRILRESQLSHDAEQRLSKEFESRLQRVSDLESKLNSVQSRMDISGHKLSYDERHDLELSYNEISSELRMAKREFAEELNHRRNEEYQKIIRSANAVVRSIASRERYDAVLQEAVYVSKSVDITDQVLVQLRHLSSNSSK
ncbi:MULTISPECIES: OmpH family outer membrane protein [Candidatus Ichthyocystis]|uniref:Putative OmpH-like outer membrane protein n=1 Tax=Candidatus Ichthyocystis hellenicum TaxID=1561003 RepID=A0A0S4M123_9BURK|nr:MULTISPECIES: OmpH family outer membrane protein [Ichthyocystis]CUT16971.1 putative OmpH-like outer membrane protein [Candidatus Ichthyocystis hellenicum]